MSELAVVCGAGGFIGGHLVRSLLDRGYQVRAVDIKPIDEWWQVHDGCENERRDLRDHDHCHIATMDADHVYNLAADMGGMGFIETHKAECMLSVLINTHLLLGAKRNQVARYFYASSACFPAGVLVMTYDGAKPIESINPGEFVLTHRGNWQRVTSVHKRMYRGPLTRMCRSGHRDVCVTPEHMVLDGTRNWVHAKNAESYHAVKIKRGAESFYFGPVDHKVLASREISGAMSAGRLYARGGRGIYRIGEKYGLSCSTTFRIRTTGDIPSRCDPIGVESCTKDFDLGWFMGLYLAEGWIEQGPTPNSQRRVVFALGPDEQSFVDRIVDVIERKLKIPGKRISKYGCKTQQGFKLHITSDKLAALMLRCFYHQHATCCSHNKTLRSEILDSPDEFLAGLVAGWWDGDGCISERSSKTRMVAASASESLVYSMLHVLTSLGVDASVSSRTPAESRINGRVIKGGVIHSVYVVGGKDAYNRFYALLKNKLDFSGALGSRSIAPKTTLLDYDTAVYNLEVENDNSYVVEGIPVHNCVYAADKQRDPNVTGLKEDDAYPAMPEDGYGWEKLFSERMCRHFREDYGLQTRVARFHNVYGPCFDSETEVLTDSGWKKFENLLRTDLIASRNSNGFMEFVEIAEFQERQHKGDMYLCCHSAMDQCVTEDHAIFSTWSTTRGTNERYVPPFQRHIVGGTKWNRARMYFTSKADWEGKRLPSHLDLPSCKMSDGRSLHSPRSIKMEDWFDFVGWYLTEGSSWATPRNFTVSIVQNPGKKAQHIVSLIKRMGFKPYINGRNIITSNKQLYEAVQNCNHGAANKRIPRWMLGSSKKLLHTLFRSMMEGDGNATGNRYSTVSKGLADDFSELCLKLGFHAWVGHEQGKGNGIYRVHISRRRQLCTKAHHRSIIQYDGKVYDVTLVRNHVMMVRRNGKPVWSGNCGSWTGGREKAPAAICRKVAEAKLSGRDYIEIWGDGTKTRSFMWIDDCIRGILMLTDSDIVEPLNIGSSEKVSINQLVDVVESIAGVKLERRYQLDKPQGVNGRNSDNTKIKALLNWEPSTPLRVGLEKTYSWIEEQVRKEMGK